MRRVVITGLGPVTPIGVGKEDFWRGLSEQRSAIGPVTRFDASMFRARSAAEMNGWDPTVFFPPNRLKRLDRYSQFAVASAYLALADAKLGFDPDNPTERVGVSYGSALGGVANAEHQHHAFVKAGPKSVHQLIALQVFGGAAHSNIAIEFGFRGVGTTNSNSCASGNVAIGEGARYIRDNWADIIVAGAAEAPLSPLTYGAFDFIRTMSRNDPAIACRPFDRDRDGFVMGEGGAAVVLEEYEQARARGAHIYAEIAGYSLNNDASHMTTPLESGAACTAAMTDAIQRAGISPQEIDYINGHASSTRLNDANEAFCIRKLFGKAARAIPVSGTKAYYGHPLGASAAIEAVICALAFEHNFLPPTLNLQNPDEDCELDLVWGEPRKRQANYILSNAFGFGGINSCVVFKRV